MRNSKQHRGLAACVLFAAIAQVLWPAPAAAQTLPTGLVNAVDQNGAITPSITTVGNTMTVTLDSPRSIYNWTSFDVGAGYVLNVTGSSVADLMVNRVLGANFSTIDGNIQSNANIWILNPNGIMVGSTGRFDVASVLLSTLGLTDADVLDANNTLYFSGAGSSLITVSPGAQLVAHVGDATLLGNSVVANGGFTSIGANTLIGADDVTVNFDPNFNSVTTYNINAGSTATNGVVVGAGASFAAERNMFMSAAELPGIGNVLLSNSGGATDINFSGGSVTLVSRDANVIAQNVFTTPGDLTISAGQMFQGNGAPTVGGDYSIAAQDFSGGVFAPTFVGTNNAFNITDTQGGLTVGGLSAPGDFSISTEGASLSTVGLLSSTNGNVSLTASDAINLGGDLNATAGSVSLNAGSTIMQPSGVINTGTLHATAGATIALNDLNNWSAAAFNAGSGSVSAVSTGNWTLLDSSSAGALTLTTLFGNALSLAGNNVQAAGNVILDGNVSGGGVTSLSSTGGSVTITGDVAGVGALTVSSASGAYFNGNVGAGAALGSITVHGASTFDGTTLRATGAIDLDDVTASNTTFNVTAGGAFAATSLNDTVGAVSVNAYGIQLGSGNAPNFTFTGAGNLDISGVLTTYSLSAAMGGSATLDGDNHITALGSFSSNGLTLRTLDSLTINDVVDVGAGDARIEAVNQSLLIGSSGLVRGHDIALSTSSLHNLSGADALDAGGHWVVYEASPGASYGGLDSGNTALWGNTIATLAPSSVTGNRYVFAYSPTLTFTSTDSAKTYGTDLSAAPGSLFAVTGYMAGVSGAYLGDDAASAYSGAPLLTSAGFDAHASVAGGPYTIGIAGGTLASAAGYQFAFNGVGGLTVDPKALTGTAATTTRTYDGTTDASGTIGLTGVVAGDTVGATGTFAFIDANAGLGKTVNLSGIALNGADSGNYTLSIPSTTLGDILQKALTGTATVDTKTYDGTPSATGSISLAGAVLGDDVAGSATLVFSDKNAGTGKTVIVSDGALSGVDAGNYTLTISAPVLGDILQKALAGTAAATTKTYDGTNAGTGTVGLPGAVTGDDVAGSATFVFSDKNAGTGKTVTVSGATLSGVDAGNYTLTLPTSVLGDILQKALTGTAAATTKTYDGTTVGTGAVGLTGAIAGDDVVGSATFAFSDKNAGTGKTVTVSGATLSGVDAGNYTVTLPATVLGDILQKALTGTATATTKTYDGTNAGTGTVGLTGAIAGDDVAGSASFAFADKDAGTGKTVTVSGATLSGVDAGNYTITLPATVLGDILQKALTGTATATTKTYDGTAAGTGTVGLTGAIAGDDVTGSATFVFSDKNAGTGKTVTVSGGVLSGVDAGNYTVTLPASVLGDILQKALTGTAMATTKTYDGTNAGTGTVGLTGAVAGDDVAGSATFALSDKNAGVGKTVTVSGATLSGVDAGNYTITLPATVLGDILQKALTGTATATTKTYDGTTVGTGTVGLTGAIAGDDVAGSATFAFSDKNAGTGKTVTVSGATLSGVDAGNYTVTLPASVLGDILQKALTGTATATTKTYDGTTAGAGTVGLTGAIAGDDVAGSATFAFSDKNAGTGKTVTVSGATLSGVDAGNYTVTLPASVLGDILQKALTGTATATTKTYDGTNAGTGTVGLTGAIAGDDVAGSATFAFSDKNAGTGKTVTVSGATLSGVDAGNYTVTLPASVLGDILQKALTGTTTANTKTYDGTTSATGSVALTGMVTGDNVTGSATFAFSDKNAGTGKTVNVSGATLSGTDAGNYTVTLPGTTLADILRRAITVTADPASRVEGASDPALTYGITSGSLVTGDALSGALARDAGEAPGQYAIGQGTLDASANYTLTFVGSNLTITPAETAPADPTEGIVVHEHLGGVVRFILGLMVERDAQIAPLQIADERPSCDPGAPSASCGASRQ